MFQVGDKVRCKEGIQKWTGVPVGSIVTISIGPHSHLASNCIPVSAVFIETEYFGVLWAYPEYLELIGPKESHLPDWF